MKIGRNELCDCGSGKKYKKCCAAHKTSYTLTIDKPSSTNRNGGVPAFTRNASSSQCITPEPFYDTYDQVLDIFQAKLIEIEESPLIYLLGMSLWEMYINKRQPLIKTVPGYAASLHYITTLYVPSLCTFTQKELAVMYQTTPSFISNTTNQIKRILADDLVSLQEILQEEEPEDPVRNTRMMGERHLWELTQLLQQKNFQTDEEIDAFLNQYNGVPSSLPTSVLSKPQQAQRLIYDAYQTYGTQRVQMAQKALKLDPACVDAYNILGEETVDDRLQGEYFKKGMDIGKEALDQSYFDERTDVFLNVMETRPFMRAQFNYACWAWEHRKLAVAIQQYEDLLQLNEEDNQGVRYMLYTLYIETEQYQKAQHLLQEYPEEYTAQYVYHQLLLEYLVHDISPSLNNFLQQALSVNPYVLDYLIGVEKYPIAIPTLYQLGSNEEALCYLDQNLFLWEKHPRLLQWLQSASSEQ
ncbi:SEC-C metal-binding domain-containing protein [Bacillus cereus]